MNTGDPPTIALIAGPTASGKSALALALAERHEGTLINADASQVYADLRILSARPSEAEEQRAPHKLFGHVDGADMSYSAPRWAEEAKDALSATLAEGRLPILVGGTGLYLRTLLNGIAPIPPIDPVIRAEVRAMPVADAYAHLDPEAAARLRPTDTTRVARALEVLRSTGRSIGAWQAESVGGIAGTVRIIPTVLLPNRNWLRDRCDLRLTQMFGEGAVAEVEALLARDLPPLAPVMRAIGVTEIADWLRGNTTRDQALALAQAATRQYAKRQYTWFRNQPPGDWPRVIETEHGLNLSNVEIRLRN